MLIYPLSLKGNAEIINQSEQHIVYFAKVKKCRFFKCLGNAAFLFPVVYAMGLFLISSFKDVIWGCSMMRTRMLLHIHSESYTLSLEDFFSSHLLANMLSFKKHGDLFST